MTRMLTIVSFAGIMVLALMPLWVEHHLFTARLIGGEEAQSYVAAKALLVSLIVLGVSMSGALALIIIRLAERRFRG
jgi:low temperature requirement protein LtrA